MSCALGRSLPCLLFFILAGVCALALTGCTLPTTAPDASVPGAALRGRVHGGNQPVVGAHVYLMAATVSGVGSAGYGLASTSLLNGTLTGHSDSIGGYVLTDGNGFFSLDTISAGPTTVYDYTCPSASTQMYLYVVGGNPGAGTNNAASFMAALGSCGNLSSGTTVWVNELTTVAAAYALAGFATDALHISIPQYASAAMQTANTTDALAQTGLQNAFANANNLVSTMTGNALSLSGFGNGTPDMAKVITLGNILAACVNSTGTVTGPTNATSCYTLFTNAGSMGGGTGTIPTETATAAINIAHYPWVSSTVMSNLFSLAASGPPFAGGYATQPSDFTISIKYGGNLGNPSKVAVDSSGNIWVNNPQNNSVAEFLTINGLSFTQNTYSGGGLNFPTGLAIDNSGYAWLANNNASDLSEFANNGNNVSSGTGYPGGGLSSSNDIAIDNSGYVWVANSGPTNNGSLSKFYGSNAVAPNTPGQAISSNAGYTAGGINDPFCVAIDGSGNVWTSNYGNNTLSELSSMGTGISAGTGYTGGGLNGPWCLAIDNAGNIWVGNDGNSSLSKFYGSNAVAPNTPGQAISGSGGYTGGGLNHPRSLAIDGSGNVWAANYFGKSLSKFSSSGVALSPPTTGYIASSLNVPYGIAIDGSGNVWVANNNSSANDMTEFVGAATPVVTPLVANIIAPYGAPASRP